MRSLLNEILETIDRDCEIRISRAKPTKDLRVELLRFVSNKRVSGGRLVQNSSTFSRTALFYAPTASEIVAREIERLRLIVM